MSADNNYRYPSKEQIRENVANETTAINVAVSALADALEESPLPDNLKVYAAIELAFKLGDKAYVEEVFNEILLFKPNQ